MQHQLTSLETPAARVFKDCDLKLPFQIYTREHIQKVYFECNLVCATHDLTVKCSLRGQV